VLDSNIEQCSIVLERRRRRVSHFRNDTADFEEQTGLPVTQSLESNFIEPRLPHCDFEFMVLVLELCPHFVEHRNRTVRSFDQVALSFPAVKVLARNAD